MTATDAAALTTFFQPVGLEGFEKRYWEQRPLLLTAGDRIGVDVLLSVPELEQILRTQKFQKDEVRLAQQGVEDRMERYLRPGSSELDLGAVLQRHHQGATLILQAFDRRHSQLGAFCRALGRQFGARTWANIYITPAQNQGFGAHYDTHDVLVLQVQGGKQWTVNALAVPAPLPSQPYQESLVQTPELFTTTLNEGDLLYLPRGFTHQAATNTSLSVHITIGLQTLTWADVLSQLVTEEVARNPAARRSIPRGAEGTDSAVLMERLTELMRALSFPENLAQSVRTASRRHIEASTHTADQWSLERLEVTGVLDGVVRTAFPAHYAASPKGQGRLSAPQRDLTFPDALRPLIEDVLSGRVVPLAQIEQHLEPAAAQHFIRLLVQEGIVTPVYAHA
ncbi:JmjC domain-containing protein [Deinococcus soli (ex Cha et al. 2016)]|uniref:Ribosomal protein L16 Arg81 hydroxylase n=2 Tax=Deinococcus soli (ex Cha et al. 2016) TaxID=1309411 RepID=A0AAE3XHC4_9DEIO|nr:cupin domain-containing protein [Deinococcus soli (ex Cha et al. 2016)]MDR6221442.1 ribosomal protein L16 Arg81 hydroxylase [Deinococcus soli (ex Cha et al. 2016)]MDR6331429.1 ribosomal protein L16 Arg81 hydroxylase [Deinococcus soli (ex Cha et al. 2016)]MDR6754588.1 ribosomal protein L16 Arg81 hydroxylase [Deinococcus soli (ex Cha et al. 2016)]